MDFSYKLYMAAKTAAMSQKSDEEYDSLWEDEEESPGEVPDAHEIAENTEISVSPPEVTTEEIVS